MQCKLHSHTKREIVSAQELKQIAGWQITTFNLPEMWKYTEGEGVTVAVLDSGCDLDHPDLANNILPGFNFIDPTKPPEDENDHGTHVTGSICAENNDYGVVGVAPKVKVIPIKVLDENGIGDINNVVKGIRYAIERNVDMMCLSLGCGKRIGNLRKAIKAAAAKGKPLFCAGGNVDKSMDALYPARYHETIAVAALNHDFKRADFSNTSKQNIDFLAPGVDILSTSRNGWYTVLSGSSTAVPFVVGVAALLLAAKRKYRLDIPLQSVEDYRTAFRNHCADLSKYKGEKEFSGYGIMEPEKIADWIRRDYSSLSIDHVS